MRRRTAEETEALKLVRKRELEALQALRDLADFDVLCRRSEALCDADRLLRQAQRRARVESKERSA